MAAKNQSRSTVPMQDIHITVPLFPLGLCVGTPGAKKVLEELGVDPDELLIRHQMGDWGPLCEDDWQENLLAVARGLRVFSIYRVGPEQQQVWIITEADRSATTILLPEEY